METTIQEIEKTSMKDQILKWGAILGVLGIIVNYLAYGVDESLLASSTFDFVSLIITTILLVVGGLQVRKSIGGLMSYKQAFSFLFFTLALSGLIGILGQIILFELIDPELGSRLAEQVIENAAALAESFGGDADAVEAAMDGQDLASQYTAVGMLKAYAYALVGYVIGAAIVGLFIRKNPPAEMA
ncbi:MAG: DUF4199 domain-containing protein [Cytophagales bacterium]|nr:DUF4199 domain-containing protein [Cytophagales bacterium]